MPTDPSIPVLLKAAMDRANLSGVALAMKLTEAGAPASGSAVSYWLDGSRKPRATYVAPLWQILQVPLAERGAWLEALGLTALVLEANGENPDTLPTEEYDDAPREILDAASLPDDL